MGRGWFSIGAKSILENLDYFVVTVMILHGHINFRLINSSCLFRWDRHQENIASQVKVLAEVTLYKTLTFSLSDIFTFISFLSQGSSSLANVTLNAGGQSLR